MSYTLTLSLKNLRILVVILGFISLSAGTCSKNTLLSQIEGVKWISSHEDNKEGWKAFRSSEYDFPPARGRSGFQVNANGEFVDFPISPRDGNEQIKGKWALIEDAKIKVTLSNDQEFTLTFQALEDGVLYAERN